MLNKYNRKQIKADKYLRKQEFVLANEVANAMVQLIEAAIKAGADEDKLMEAIDG